MRSETLAKEEGERKEPKERKVTEVGDFKILQYERKCGWESRFTK